MVAFVSDGNPEEAWDAFFRRPALSFTHNDTLRELFETICDPNQPVTLFLGAGVSLDAGFPSWNALIANMASTIDKRWSEPVRLDPSDAMRKAEYVVNMVKEDTHRTEGEIVRDALYPAKKSQAAIGPLAEAIANLAVVLGKRISIATTNFDVLVEDRLKGRAPAATVRNFSLSEWRTRQKELKGAGTDEDADYTVLHLHGILEPNKDARGPLILTESSFLEHGDQVRKVVSKLLVKSCVVFIGVSLTDPNLIGPLWDLKKAGSDYKRPYVFQVAAPEYAKGNQENSKAYVIKRALYLSQELNLGPVFLKAYSQLPQTLHELAFAAKKGSGYLADDSTCRYGHRLQQALATCYELTGCADDADVPAGAEAEDLSRRLHEELYGANGLVNEFDQFAEVLRTSTNPDNKALYADHGAGFAEEKFALFLWLRSRRASGEAAEYQLNLLGSSAYVHREPWSLDRAAEIGPHSRHPIARAAFSGLTQWQNVDDNRQWQLWRGMVAVPFTAHGLVDDLAHKDKKLDLLTLGGISLNTTHLVRPDAEKLGRLSVLTAFRASQLPDLYTRLASIAEKVTTTPAK